MLPIGHHRLRADGDDTVRWPECGQGGRRNGATRRLAGIKWGAESDMAVPGY